MFTEISRVDVWVGELADRPGACSEKLEAVAKSGADLEFIITRRTPERPGHGVVFMAPFRGPAQIQAARRAGLAMANNLHCVRLEAPDKPGLAAKITKQIATEGITLKGLTAASVNRRSVVYFAFDNEPDTKRAEAVIRRVVAPIG